MKQYVSRRGVLAALMSSTAVALTKGLLDKAGVNGGTAGEARTAERKNALRASQLEGQFFDAAGNPLTEESTTPGPAAILQPELWSWIIGYNNKFGVSGIRKTLRDAGYDVGDHVGARGAACYLTLDTELQALAYELCCTGDVRSCCVVIDADTGGILAYINHPSAVELDANQMSDTWKAEAEASSSRYWYPVPTTTSMCGSTMKIVDAASILKAGVEQSYTDTGEYGNIHNHNNRVYGTVDLAESAKNSINTYFSSKIAEDVGYETWASTCQEFGINAGQEPMAEECIIRLENGDTTAASQQVAGEKAELALAAIGQAKVQAAPVSILRWISAVISKSGGIYKLFCIHHLEQEDGTVIWEQPEEIEPVSTPLAEEALHSEMQKVFSAAAEKYGLYKAAPKASLIVSKTGTGEIDPAADINDTYIAVGLRTASGRNLAFILSRHGVQETSTALLSAAKTLTERLSRL